MPAVKATANQSVRDCKIEEAGGGALINVETKVAFSYTDACVKLDPLVGGDREAGPASVKAVTEFLAKTFGG